MIITINESNKHLYDALFERASAKLNLEGSNKIKTLNEYYYYLPQLIKVVEGEVFDARYLMLPIDEVPVEIDANNRAMKVPATFTRCASVQNDHIAETIMFTIDRYYDYIDLSTTSIYVQWTSPDDEGATRIELVDVSEANKIRFGWPLTEEITKTPGVVKFSVRFFRKDENNDKVVYSFNTLSNEIMIKAALQPVVNPDAEVEKPLTNGFFSKAIIQSQISMEGVPTALAPSFSAEAGLDLPETAALEDNELILKAQAIVADTGELNYQWKYAETATGEFTALEGAEEEYVEVTPDKREGYDRYYYKQTEDAVAYSIYAGPIPPAEEDNITLYERYTKYTMPAEGKVTGVYKITATNTMSNTNKASVDSTACVLPGPAEITLTKDLVETVALPAPDAEGKSEVTLDVEVAADENNAAVTYQWSGHSSSEILEEIAGATEATYTVTQPGWYKVSIDSTLNRETKEKDSTTCAVYAYPEVPTVELTSDTTPDENGNIDIGHNEKVTFTVNAVIPTKDGVAADLYKGELEYTWEVDTPDSADFIELVAGDIAVPEDQVVNLKTNTITLFNPIKDSEEANYVRAYRCKVKHTLMGQTVESVTNTFNVL